VLDVDGTLVNKQGVISETDRQALREVQEAGLTVSLCTGRVLNACSGILSILQLKGPHIFFDGALVYDFTLERPVYLEPIPPEAVKDASELALRDSIPLDLFSFDKYYVTQKSWRTELRRTLFGLEATFADFDTLWQKEQIIRGGIITNTEEDTARVRQYAEKIKSTLYLSWSVIPKYPGYHFINVLNNGVSKGRAVEALASHLGLHIDQVMAIGDGTNDVSLLAAAGLAIAMDNAPDSLKAQADYITADVEHCGVAQAIRRFLMH
jgi:Cof subfamily protein (haloacid dehalogenase superfamily)